MTNQSSKRQLDDNDEIDHSDVGPRALMTAQATDSPSSQQIYEHLRGALARRQLAPGHKVSLRDISEQFGVSVTPVKEAIDLLQADGLVTVSPRSGTVVRGISLEDIKQIFEVREMIEDYAARSARDYLTDASVARAGEIIEAMAACIDGEQYVADMIDHFLALDFELHEIIVASLGNSMILDTYNSYNVHLHIVNSFHLRAVHNAARGQVEHQQIVEAMRTRDTAGLREALQRHILGARNEIVRVVSVTGGEL